MSEFRILNIVSSLHKVLKLKNFLSKVVMETMTNESCNCDILDIGSLALTYNKATDDLKTISVCYNYAIFRNVARTLTT